jgi:hypothetical protein
MRTSRRLREARTGTSKYGVWRQGTYQAFGGLEQGLAWSRAFAMTPYSQSAGSDYGIHKSNDA